MSEQQKQRRDTEDDSFKFTNFDEFLFDALCKGGDRVHTDRLLKGLQHVGIRQTDPRLKETLAKIRELQGLDDDDEYIFTMKDILLDQAGFTSLIHDNIDIIQRGFTKDMVIPAFYDFKDSIDRLYKRSATNTQGKVSTFIDQLARVDPKLWGVSVCTIDGQRHSIGDVTVPLLSQSILKPILYALALHDLGEEFVHKYVGQEPSGEQSDVIKLGHKNEPHNPMINSGAIAIMSLIKRHLNLADRFDYVTEELRKCAGGEHVGFNNAAFLSEREAGDRNMALAYYMQENKCFPEGSDLHKTMDFYFQMNAVELNCESGSVMAATLANGGICPITGERVLNSTAVRHSLSLMHSCGMYDYSGEFAFKVGLPAKSAVSGAIMLVVPNVGGFFIWSPPIDVFGSGVKALQFCNNLVDIFSFHHLDNLRHTSLKIDPCARTQRSNNELQGAQTVKLLFNAANGDVVGLRRMFLAGYNMQAVDYDGRSALHIAAAEGHIECVRFLLERCEVSSVPKDRWEHTPYDDAQTFGKEYVMSYLKANQAYAI